MSSEQFDALWTGYWLDVQSVGPLTSTRYRILLRLLGRHPVSRILDVGCGPGRLLTMLHNRCRGARILGVEPSAQAREAAPPPLREFILNGTLADHAPQVAAFRPDLVTCSEVLEHVENPDALVAQLVAVAEPGALMLFTVPAGRRYWSVQDEAAGHLRRFDIDEFEGLLARNGLVVERVFTWGGPVSALYNRLLNRVGPKEIAGHARSWLGQLGARVVTMLLRVDDLFVGRDRFQLFAVAHKAS
jgi:SAM-dependent methyltransferase